MALVDLFEARQAWNLENAVGQAQPGNLFPSRVAWSAVQDNPRILQVLDGSARTGLSASQIELVPVPKADRATRLAGDMPMEDQIVYAALVEAIRSALPEDLVTFTGQNQSYADFERFPLEVESPSKYVFEGDVVAFYEYIGHERLLTELVGLTGLAGVAEGLIDLLEAWLPGERGLPQGPAPSAPLADIYIAPVSRALARAGFVHSRYSDDFRVPVDDYNQLRELQLLLEQALRDLGLTLSSLKVRTPKIETYRRNLEQIPDLVLLSPLAREVLETVQVDEYFGGVILGAADMSQDEIDRASQVFREQLQVVRVEVVNTRLMRWSLGRLGTAGSPLPLEGFPLLLRRYAHLTQTIAAYIQVLMGTELESNAVGAVIDWTR
ncbi:MAG: reverse transcriptase domain-containing protein, partial [Candidatus Dormibacteraceae bacterium]